MTYLLFFHERMVALLKEHDDLYRMDLIEDVQLSYEEETGEGVPARFRLEDLDGRRQKRLEYARSVCRQNNEDEAEADWRNAPPSIQIMQSRW